MKSLIITRNITKLLSKLAAVCLAIYAAIIFFIRAAFMTSVTAQDLAVFALWGMVALTLYCIYFVLKVVYATLKHMQATGNSYTPSPSPRSSAVKVRHVSTHAPQHRPAYSGRGIQAA